MRKGGEKDKQYFLYSLVLVTQNILFLPFFFKPRANDYLAKKKSYDQPRQHIKMQRHYFANKGPSSQSYGFSSSHM